MAEIINLTSTESPTVQSEHGAAGDVQRSATKKSRFRFSTQLDLLLCKAVCEKGAHVPPVNKKMEFMNAACALFIEVIPSALKERYMEPKGKTVSDRFDLIMTQRRSEDKKNRASSGISEEQTELNVLLDDLILQRDEMDESRRKEKEEKTATDQKLDDASKEIRSKAVTRMSSEASDESERKRRKVISLDSDDEELELLKESLAQRRENEVQKIELERERVEIERERAEVETERVRKEQDLEAKRLALEEAKLEMNNQKLMSELAERRAAIEERKAMVSALSALAMKLS